MKQLLWQLFETIQQQQSLDQSKDMTQDNNNISDNSTPLSTNKDPSWSDTDYIIHLYKVKAQRSAEIRNQNKVLNSILLRCVALHSDLSSTLEAGVDGLDL